MIGLNPGHPKGIAAMIRQVVVRINYMIIMRFRVTQIIAMLIHYRTV